MPSIPKHIDKICAYCAHYRLTEAGPRCEFWDKIFPEHSAWAYNPEKKKPGERTCKNWS